MEQTKENSPKPSKYRLAESKRIIDEMIAAGMIIKRVTMKGVTVELSPQFRRMTLEAMKDEKQEARDIQFAKDLDEYTQILCLQAVIRMSGDIGLNVDQAHKYANIAWIVGQFNNPPKRIKQSYLGLPIETDQKRVCDWLVLSLARGC